MEATISVVKCFVFRLGYINPSAKILYSQAKYRLMHPFLENFVIDLDNAIKMRTVTQVLWMGRNDVRRVKTCS